LPDDTIWDREPHTAVKHDIYDGYLDAWLPIILPSWGSGTYAEGYAGPGIYRGSEPGSPIRALHRLREARAAHPHLEGKLARFVLVEKRSDRVARLLEELRRELNHPMPNGQYHDATLHMIVRQGECETTLPQALTDAGAWEAPILAVLDSFGGGSTQQLLRQFANQRGGEVLVTVEPQHFVRNLDPDRADEVFGSAAWRDVERLHADEKRSYISARLVDSIHKAGFQYVISFGLQTLHGGELLLQFGTNHPRGLEKLKDSLWRADPIQGARFRDPNDPDQMLFDFTPEPELSPLRRLLLANLDSRPGRCAIFEQLRTFTNEHTVYRVPHVAAALEYLRSAAAISTSPQQSRIQSRTPKTVRITSTGGEQGRLLD
jgi:three-Cys-motif partner protein